jgi:hypothetical protein
MAVSPSGGRSRRGGNGALSQRISTEIVRDALEALAATARESASAEAERQALKAHFLVTNPPLIEKPEAYPEEPEIASSHY